MANLNRIILVGTTDKNPESRLTVDGQPVTKFQLSVNRWTKPGAPEEADVVDIVSWGRLAEICGQLVKKSKLILVEGSIQIRSFSDESGQRKWVTEVLARNVQLLGAQLAKEVAEEDPIPPPFSGDEDLPF